ncbi:uncharacterized protein L969DRAFT_85346 [Mixia osmundae IAM 14324]|nr:uncharacterized protein L969DRAFT_85346 [Mixia osmundae IAM 14324]KEI41548.1 hypothetical protein L969DRAFT_85346 [Mixia osmundae IAM 14324]
MSLMATGARHASFSAVPKAFIKLGVRASVAVGGAAGVGAYANYKIEGFRTATSELYNNTLEAASNAYGEVALRASDAKESLTSFAQGGIEGLNSFASARAEAFRKWREGDGSEGSSSDPDGDPEDPLSGPTLAGVSLGLASTMPLVLDADSSESASDSSADLMLLTRKLIEIRTILLSIDHGESLQLPSIVVIGSQSSGKSSVLEAIVGREFLPKGNNMVTRRPIELTLIHTPATANNAQPDTYAEFPAMGTSHLTDFAHVQQILTDANLSVPEAEAVSDKPIELRIYGPRLPDLTMVDLPGYVQIASLDQPEELKDKIAKLCDKYIRAPNIILAVCAADVDLANSPALRASRRVDPLGMRTIGVVTKMDLVAPEIGSQVLSNERYPLALGYVGVVCKAAAKQREGRSVVRRSDVDLTGTVVRQEDSFFGQNRQYFSQPGMLVGTDNLRRRLMQVLEESMGNSLHGIAEAVAVELEEASYQFKVQYNDRSISAESYVAEVMDKLKLRIGDLAKSLDKQQVRKMLKQALDDRVMEVCAQVYWSDAKTQELVKLAGDRKLKPEDLDPHWLYKLEAASSGLTKSGVGRISTQLVVDTIRSRINLLMTEEPLNYHPDAAERVAGFADAILRDRYTLTADQVENCVKPYKYEVDVESKEWEEGRQRSLALVEREQEMCQNFLDGIRHTVGGRRLKGAVEYVRMLEDRERRRSARRLAARNAAADGTSIEDLSAEDLSDPTREVYNPALVGKAREALFLSDRLQMLKLRANVLKSARCKSGPDAKSFCPEAFLNVVSDKLAYTAVQFVNIELLAEFFYQFPRDIDTRLGNDLDRNDILQFARENPAIKRHLDLQDRKEKLELVHDKLESLTRLQQDRLGPGHPGRHTAQRKGLLGYFSK